MKTRKMVAIVVMAMGVVGTTFGELPPGWDEEVSGGAVAPPPWGRASYDPLSDTWILECGGYSSLYVYKSLNGDGRIIACIRSFYMPILTPGGVEIRENLDVSAKRASVEISDDFSFHYWCSDTDYGYGEDTQISDLPYWVMLERTGDTFTGYISPNGLSWTAIGSAQIRMSAHVLVGLTLSSSSRVSGRAEFDNVKVESGTGGWTISGDNMYSAVSGNVGIGTENPEVKLDVEGAFPSAKFGGSMPIYVHSNWPMIGFNAYNKNGWKFGKGSTNHYGWVISADPYQGHMSILNTPEPGAAGSELRLDTKLTILQNGNVGIGTENPQGKLDVNGSIYQRGSRLHADYVFEPCYELESIDEHSQFMWEHKHLEAIPKAIVDGNGQEIVEVGAHHKGIVEELEKAHIYIEQLHNRIGVLEEKLAKLEAQIATE